MVNVDLSKVLPEEPHNYLAPFLPGVFFEVSILLAKPDLVLKLASNAQQGLAIGHYLLLGIALFLAFAIGNGFLLLVTFIEFLLSYFYSFQRFFWKELCKRPLHRFSVWLLRKSKPGLSLEWAGRFNRYVQMISRSEQMKNIQTCWHTFASRLLETHYGIVDVTQGEWDVLYWTLQSPTAKEQRGGRSVMMVASHATGWSGLVATRIAPSLHNGFYLAFCIVMIFSGLLHHYYVNAFHNDPCVTGYMIVRAVLREFRRPPTQSGKTPES